MPVLRQITVCACNKANGNGPWEREDNKTHIDGSPTNQEQSRHHRTQMAEKWQERASKFLSFESPAMLFLGGSEQFMDGNLRTLECCTRKRSRRLLTGSPRKFMRKSWRKRRDGGGAQRSEAVLWMEHSRYDGTLFWCRVSLNIISTMGKYYLQAIVAMSPTASG